MSGYEFRNSLDLLHELVEINSSSRNSSGVNAVQDVVARQLTKLGFDVSLESHPEKPTESGKFLVGVLTQSPRNKGQFVDLLTHADTVYGANTHFSGLKVDLKQGIAQGPGVIDDKGGIVVALAGLKDYLRQSEYKQNIRFICSPAEEIGSPGFHGLFKSLSQVSRMVLGFEPGLDDGSIIDSRRGSRWYEIDVRGREGHPGRDRKMGINAAHELAHKIARFHGMNDEMRDLTVSTGQIQGGAQFNIICGHASAKLDVRFSDLETREEAHREIEEIVGHNHIGFNQEGRGPISTYQIIDECPPVFRSSESDKVIQKYLDIIEDVERRPVRALKSGGAADCNYMSRDGLVILDGLGAVGGGMHTSDEFIRLQSLSTRAEGLSRFLQCLS